MMVRMYEDRGACRLGLSPDVDSYVQVEAASGAVVTICIPSFNRAELVAETLDSILAQTYPHWEALVVEDGSTDASASVISSYAIRDPRVRLISREREPKGACTCRNIAVEHARGSYVMFLDTDDLLAPFCLEQRVKVMEETPNLDFAIFPMLVFAGNPRTTDRLWNIDTGEDDLLRLLRLDPICQGTGTLWRRESFIRAGMWDESLGMWQDIELHLRAFAGEYNFVKRLDLPPDVYIRETAASLSRGVYQSRPKLESRAIVVRRAAALLQRSGRSELISQLRYVCAAVVLGAAGSGNLDLARDLRAWAEREGVLNAGDAWRLRFVELCRLSRLDRLAGVRKAGERLTATFQVHSSVGLVRQPSRETQVGPSSPVN